MRNAFANTCKLLGCAKGSLDLDPLIVLKSRVKEALSASFDAIVRPAEYVPPSERFKRILTSFLAALATVKGVAVSIEKFCVELLLKDNPVMLRSFLVPLL